MSYQFIILGTAILTGRRSIFAGLFVLFVIRTSLHHNLIVMKKTGLQCKGYLQSATIHPLIFIQHTRIHGTLNLSLAITQLPDVVAIENRVILEYNIPFPLTHVRRMAGY